MGQNEYVPVGQVELAGRAENSLGRAVNLLLADTTMFVGGLFLGVYRNEPSTFGRLILFPASPQYTPEGLNTIRDYLLNNAFADNKEENMDESDSDVKSHIGEDDISHHGQVLVFPKIYHYEKIGVVETIHTKIAKIQDNFDLELIRESGESGSGRNFFGPSSDEKDIIRTTRVYIYPEPWLAHLVSRYHQLGSNPKLKPNSPLWQFAYHLVSGNEILIEHVKAITSGVDPFGNKLISQLESLELAQAEKGQAQQGQGAKSVN